MSEKIKPFQSKPPKEDLPNFECCSPDQSREVAIKELSNEILKEAMSKAKEHQSDDASAIESCATIVAYLIIKIAGISMEMNDLKQKLQHLADDGR